MSKDHNTKLDIISKIDEKIIDEVTDSRILLSKKLKFGGTGRKKIIFIGTCAASFLLICTILLAVIIPIITQIPVYRGMTVSGPITEEQTASEAYGVLSVGQFDTVKKGNDETSQNLPESTESPIDNYFTVEGSGSAIYYTTPNEDIYITIHIDNPKQYEILSFTLNGVKYQSYMFEPGSTSEALILKLNVGDVEGVVEYTIDAIKYVDGTEIKDVRMKGDKTVKVGVYSENQPKASVTNQNTDYFEMSFDVSVTDPLGLIEKSGGELYAAISDEFGTEIVAQEKISIGTSSVKLDGLNAGKAYKRLIIAYYDSLDGNGFGMHIIDEKDFYTKGYVEIVSLTPVIGKNSVTFDLEIDESKNVKLEKIELFTADGTAQKEIDTDKRIFEWLYGEQYKIIVSYTFDLNDGQGTRKGFAESRYFDIIFNISTVVKNGVTNKGYSKTQQVYHQATGDYRTHLGIDVEVPGSDKSVYAVVSGTVTDILDKGGKTVVITLHGSNVEYHFSSLTGVTVEIGQKLSGGEVIGQASEGYLVCATGVPMVHIEAYVDGEIVSPISLKP